MLLQVVAFLDGGNRRVENIEVGHVHAFRAEIVSCSGLLLGGLSLGGGGRIKLVGKRDHAIEPVRRSLVQAPVSGPADPDGVHDVIPEVGEVSGQPLRLEAKLLLQPPGWLYRSGLERLVLRVVKVSVLAGCDAERQRGQQQQTGW